MTRLWLLCAILCSGAGTRCLAQTCTASATLTAFGTYQPLSGAPDTTTGTVTVTCNPGVLSVLVSYSIQLGTGTGGSFSSRSLSNGGTHIGYQLYRDLAYSQIWGDGTGSTFTVTDGYTLGVVVPVVRNYTAYGKIPANQNAGVGAYGDMISVLLSY